MTFFGEEILGSLLLEIRSFEFGYENEYSVESSTVGPSMNEVFRYLGAWSPRLRVPLPSNFKVLRRERVPARSRRIVVLKSENDPLARRDLNCRSCGNAFP